MSKNTDASSGPESCWTWTGTIGGNNYGVIGIGGRSYKAHRMAYECANGPIESGLVVRHKCDNKLCVNPAHLEVGTVADNSRDMVTRGRSSKGSSRPDSILTDEIVATARRRYNTDLNTACKDLYKEYGVSQTTMLKALRGETWAHVSEPVAIMRRRRRSAFRRKRIGPCMKLNEQIVSDMRIEYRSGAKSMTEISKDRGISKQGARSAIRGLTWAYISEPPVV